MAETSTKRSASTATKKRVARKVTAKPAEQAVTEPTPAPQEESAPDDLSALQSQLEAIEQQRLELERRIHATRRTELRAFCTGLLKYIRESGHDVGDVLDELNRRRARASARTATTARKGLTLKTLAYNDNPSLTYVRGVTPDWMRSAMVEKGFDPASIGDRRAFRERHMHEVETEAPSSTEAP